MPTHAELQRFLRDYTRLTPSQRAAFGEAVTLFVAGVAAKRFDPRLRVKRVQGAPQVWEMSWAPDGRATFEYGPEVRPGEAHIIWRRIGTHSIFRQP